MTKHQLNSKIDTYYLEFCKELTTEDSLLLKGTRIIIPISFKQDIMKQLTTQNLGLATCL